MVNQDERVLDFLYENKGKSFSAYFVSDIMLIPQPTVRRIFQQYIKAGAIAKDKTQLQSKKNVKYHTNDTLMKNYVISLKKQKLKLQVYFNNQRYMKNQRLIKND